MRPVILTVAFLVGFVTLTATSQTAEAQVTEATVRGRVLSGDDGTAMAGVSVTLVNLSTGSTKVAVTEGDGQYAFTGLEVGGPYQLDAELPGFKSFRASDIYLSAGKARDIRVEMKVEEEVINVQGTSMTRNQSSRTVITAQDIADLPSITRDPRDLIRLSPDADVEGNTTASPTLSIAGNNSRFNSITVDGIREDDDFGLNASGYPTNRSPISLAAIQEMAIESAPFDVRYSKFMGGNVNIITKSGTNDFHGEIFGTYSSSGMMGTQTGDNKLDNQDFREYRYGATLSGPIVKNKVHFILSFEGLQSTVPNDYGPAGSTALNVTQKVTLAEMQQIQAIAQSVYGFNAGIPNADAHETDAKIFSKLDYQIDNQQRLVMSYQRTAGTQDNIEPSTSTTLTLSSDDYNTASTLNAGAVRLFSDWTDRLSTQVEVDAKTVTSIPTSLNGNDFMQAEIKTPEGGTVYVGPDEFQQLNSLNDDTYHGKAEANYLQGINLITAGAEYEILHIDNEFVPELFGAAEYTSVANFQAEMPKEIAYENATNGNPASTAAKWNSGNIGLYIQDAIKLSDRLTVQGGLRLETYNLGDEIDPNPTFYQHYGFWNTSTLSGRSILMPRGGFSWLPDDKINIHGGLGMYSGGSPTVWVSNAYSNDGVRLAEAFSENGSVVDGFNGRTIPTGLQQQLVPGTGEVDALDPNFRLPSLFKVGGGFDYNFLGATLKLFYTYSKTLEGVEWIDLRRNATFIPDNTPVGTTQDGRAEYSPNFDTDRGFDMLLTNSNQGYGHVFTAALEKTWPFGLTFGGTYAFEHVEDTTPANSSRSVSNFDNSTYIDPNTPLLGISDYNRKNRFTARVTLRRAFLYDITKSERLKHVNTTIGLFAEARSGQPYSWTFGDANFGETLGQIFGEDASIASHDSELFFVPKNDSDVILNGITPQQFDAFLNATGLAKYRGEIAPRNVFESPWFNHVDMRISQDIPTPWPTHRAQVYLDITNVGNLLNSHWGRSEAAPFPYANPAVDVAIDPATNKYIYSNLASPNQYVVDLISSVWRISIGAQYNF